MCIEGNQRDNNELAKALHAKKSDIARLEAELRELQSISEGLSCDIDHAKAELCTKSDIGCTLRGDLKRLEETL